MSSPLRDAVAAWCKPRTVLLQGIPQTIPNKAELLAVGRIPSEVEEQELRGIPDALSVPEVEWGGICLLAERIRKNTAESELTDDADAQIAAGRAMLDYVPSDFVRWPWKAMHDLVGGMAPGTLHYVVCPSKGGKTTLMRSAKSHWMHQFPVYYAGFEMRAKTLRMMDACESVGVDPGHVLSGAAHEWSDWPSVREKLNAAFSEQEVPGSPYQNVRYSGFESVDRKAVQGMMETAKDWGARVVIVDHVDHVDGSTGGGNDYSITKATQHLFLNLALKWNLVVILTSQMNTANKLTDLWRDHRDLRMEYIKYGALKVEVATNVIGFWRPVKPTMTKEEKLLVEARQRAVYDMLTPGVNAFNLMASRNYGSRIGQKGLVGWDRGRIIDLPRGDALAEEAATHWIRTRRDV